MTTYTIFDLEADGFNPTKIYCLSAYIDGEIYTMTDYDDMRRYFQAYDVYIGHYITLFDIPVVERILDIKVDKTLIDTVPHSWYLFSRMPDGSKRRSHGLEAWGVEFGVPKPVITDWFNLPLDDYIDRCEEDVKINVRLWNKINAYLKLLYPEKKDYWKFVKYLQFKIDCVREQEAEGWKLDLKYCSEELKKLEDEQATRYQKLEEVMPKVPVIVKRLKPKVMYKQDGSVSTHGKKWYHLLAEQGLPHDYDDVVEVITKYDEPNPSSGTQLKNWLFSLGWKPRTFKEVKDKKTGVTREIEQISLPMGAGLCDSVKELYEVEPNLELLDGYFVLQHRIGLLNGFLRDVDGRGFLKASVAGLTNTLRFKHSGIVNLPKSDKLFASAVRGSLIVDEGYDLIGSDMSSLEDRLKQHYIYPHDKEYVEEMNKPDFDPHLDLAVRSGKMTLRELEDFKGGNRGPYKRLRDMFKTTNYACQYGAGGPKIAKSANVSVPEGKELHKAYWDRNWAIKKVAEEQKVLSLDNGDMWLLNPVNGFFYSLRYMKDVFSTLVQGTASYVFDLWVGLCRAKGLKLTAQFHDELVTKVKAGQNEQVKNDDDKIVKVIGATADLINEAINECNEILRLNRELGVDIQLGQRYSEIH